MFRLQFDDFQIVSSSHDDTILIWDFLDPIPPGPMEVEQSSVKQETSNASREGGSLLVTHSSAKPMQSPS